MTDLRFPCRVRGRACKVLRVNPEYVLVEYKEYGGMDVRYQRVQAGEIQGFKVPEKEPV